MRKSFLIGIMAGAFALGGIAYARTTQTRAQPTVQATAPVPMTDMQMQKVTAGSAGIYYLNVPTGTSNFYLTEKCVLPAGTYQTGTYNPLGPDQSGGVAASNTGNCI